MTIAWPVSRAVQLLGGGTAATLARTDYHVAAEGQGGKGLVIRSDDKIGEILEEAKRLAKHGFPVLVNVHLAKTNFREGLLSI